MAAGFPVKENYVAGDVLTAADMNDLSETLNYLDPTAKGDLFPASSATELTRLAVGANDTVLTADSAEATGMKWATPAGASQTWSYIGDQTMTGTTFTISGLSSYNSVKILLKAVKPSTNTNIIVTFNSDTGSNYDYQGIQFTAASVYASTIFARAGATATDGIPFVTTTGTTFSAGALEYSEGTSTAPKMFNLVGATANVGGITNNISGVYSGTSAISTVSFTLLSGTFDATSTVYVWGAN
jgi:hypothetical protein